MHTDIYLLNKHNPVMNHKHLNIIPNYRFIMIILSNTLLIAYNWYEFFLEPQKRIAKKKMNYNRMYNLFLCML